MPILGLVPVALAVLASEGRFGGPSGAPAASGPVAGPTPPMPTPLVVAPSQPAPTDVAARPIAAPAAVTPVARATAAAVVTGAAPTAAPAEAEATSIAGPFRTYRVQPGDTVRFIAQVYGVSAASIAQASGLQNADNLRIGQVLTIPSQPGWLYRIQPGESLNQVAARTGVPTEIILSASNLANEAVHPGDVILIPDRSGTTRK